MYKLYLLLLLLLSLLFLSGCSIFPEQVTLKKDHRKPIVNNKTYALRVAATAYTSRANETDKTPYLAAWNNRLRPGVKSIAVSRDLLKMGLTNGTKVRISGLSGKYVVLDKMHKRWKKKIDIYMGRNRRKAIRWGKRYVTIFWKKKTITEPNPKTLKRKTKPKDRQKLSPTHPTHWSLPHLFHFVADLLPA